MNKKKTEERVTLFAAILKKQHEALRTIAFHERKSLAEITREAIEFYLKNKIKKSPKKTKVTEEFSYSGK